MLDRANRGPEPTAEILRAIRHGVAAGACREAWRATGDSLWLSKSVGHSAMVRERLHQAAPALDAALASAEDVGASPSISARRSSARDKRMMPMSLSPDES